MRLTAENLKSVTAILKKRFPNLSVEETIELATEIIDALYATPDPA